jgi:hypothetical protein
MRKEKRWIARMDENEEELSDEESVSDGCRCYVRRLTAMTKPCSLCCAAVMQSLLAKDCPQVNTEGTQILQASHETVLPVYI